MAILVRDSRRIRGATLFPRVIETETVSTGSGSPSASTATGVGEGDVLVQTVTSDVQASTATAEGVGTSAIESTDGDVTATTATATAVGDVLVQSTSANPQAETATVVGQSANELFGSGSPQADTATTGQEALSVSEPVISGIADSLEFPSVPPATANERHKRIYHEQLRSLMIRYMATKSYAKQSKVTQVTSNYIVADEDEWLIVNGSGAAGVTLPLALESPGRRLVVQNKSSSGWVIVNVVGIDTVNGTDHVIVTGEYEAKEFISTGTEWLAK